MRRNFRLHAISSATVAHRGKPLLMNSKGDVVLTQKISMHGNVRGRGPRNLTLRSALHPAPHLWRRNVVFTGCTSLATFRKRASPPTRQGRVCNHSRRRSPPSLARTTAPRPFGDSPNRWSTSDTPERPTLSREPRNVAQVVSTRMALSTSFGFTIARRGARVPHHIGSSIG